MRISRACRCGLLSAAIVLPPACLSSGAQEGDRLQLAVHARVVDTTAKPIASTREKVCLVVEHQNLTDMWTADECQAVTTDSEGRFATTFVLTDYRGVSRSFIQSFTTDCRYPAVDWPTDLPSVYDQAVGVRRAAVDVNYRIGTNGDSLCITQ
jgi:hypothetical protein